MLVSYVGIEIFRDTNRCFMALVDTAPRGLKPENKPKKYSDGGGLFLLVNPNGSKLWRLAFRFDGKQKTLAFGAYPKVTLADARALRDRAKKALADGIDPARHDRREPT